MRLEIQTPSPDSIEIIAACSQLNSPAASNLFTQFNCYCAPTECKRSVYTRQSLMQTMQYNQLLCRTSYATAPLMQTMQEHQLLCRTYYAKHLLCEAPSYAMHCSKLPANGRSLQIRPLDSPTQDAKYISKYRPNSSINFRHKPT